MLKYTSIVSLSVTLLLTGSLSAQDNPLLPGGPTPIPAAEAPAGFSPSIDLQSFLDPQAVFPTTPATDGIWNFTAAPGRQIVRIPFVIVATDKEIELSTSEFDLKRGRMLAWEIRAADEPANFPTVPAAEVEGISADGLPRGVPRFAKKITLKPDGKIAWKMDRSIIGATIGTASGAASNPYILKMNRDAMEGLKPPRPPNTVATTPAEREAKRVAEATYRAAASEFSRLSRSILKLPDEFSGQKPRILWAIFEIPAGADTLEISGPAPLPWGMPLQSLQTIQDKAKLGPATVSNDAYADTLLAAVKAQAKPHPFTLRLVSYAILKSDLLKIMEAGDPAYQAAELILKSKDKPSTGALSEKLALIQSDAAKALFKTAVEGGALTSSAKIKSLESLLSAVAGEPKRKVEVANSFLIDPNGPDPKDVINTILTQATKDLTTTKMLETDLKFTDIPSSRIEATIAGVIETAHQFDLARTWLNNQLLDPNQPVIAAETLKQFSTSNPPNRIMLKGKEHNLYSFLNDVDAGVRAKAWQCLQRVEMEAGGANATWPNEIEKTALLYDKTPTQAVAFLVRHKTDGISEALAQIVLVGDDDAAKEAMRNLLTPDMALEALINKLPSIGDRCAFAQRLYQLQGQPIPLSANLMRSASASKDVVKWFGQEIKSGKVPPSSEWVKIFSEEKRYLELIASSDKELALGALAALITANNGTDADARELLPKFKETESIGDLLKLWDATKSGLDNSSEEREAARIKVERNAFITALETFSGTYKGALDVNEGINFAMYDMGNLAVRVEGATVTIGKMQAQITEEKVPRLVLTPEEMAKQGIKVHADAKPVDFKVDKRGNWFTSEIMLEGDNAKGNFRLMSTK